jgi:hypothetical protein
LLASTSDSQRDQLLAVAAARLADELETFLREHDVFGGDPPTTPDMVPPHASRGRGLGQHDPPLPLHELRVDLLLWDAN